MATTKVLASAATLASYNMMFQLMIRILTFILNAYILRHITKEMLGVINVRLMLLYTTALVIVREAFRKACLSKMEGCSWQQVVNLVWCTFPICLFIVSIFSYVWINFLEQPDVKTIPYYEIAVVCFAISALFEILSEPMWIAGQCFLFVRLRAVMGNLPPVVRIILTTVAVVYFRDWGLIAVAFAQAVIEGLSFVARVTVTAIAVTYFSDWGLLAAAGAQLLSTFIYPTFYIGYFMYYFSTNQKYIKEENLPIKSLRDFLPSKLDNQPIFHPKLVQLTWSFYKQSFLKEILSNGERFAMTVFNMISFGEQGLYDIVNNLGSMVARFIFYPVEDGGYLFFTKCFTRGLLIKDQNKDSAKLACRVLESLLTFMVLIGLTIPVFGYAYSFLLLDIYGGSGISSGTGPSLLRWYCVYVFIIAINGVTECFVFAAMSQKDVDRYNHKMLLFTLGFLLATYTLGKQFGGAGLIMANCLNMLSRSAHSLYYIHHFSKGSEHYPLRGLFPSPLVIACFIGSFLITYQSEKMFCCAAGWFYRFVHIGIGAVCLLVVLGAIFIKEKRLLSFIMEQYQERKKHKKAE